MMTQYKAFQDAVAIIEKAKLACTKELGSAFNNPAWEILYHAQRHLAQQMTADMKRDAE